MRKALFLSAVLMLVVSAAQAQFQYAAKFICESPGERVGFVRTVVNIHPAFKDVRIEKLVSVGLPAERPGKVTEPIREELKAGQTIQVDCADTLKRFGLAPPIDGFLVIRSTDELDVVAVYRSFGADRVLRDLEIERVPMRKMP